MNLKFKLIKNLAFLVIYQEMFSLGKFSYLIIVFTKRKVGTYTHIAMPINGNVHLLFHNV